MKLTTNEAMEFNRLLGSKIRTARKEMGFSMKDVADKVGVTHQQFWKYEKGINSIHPVMMKKISSILAIGVDELLNLKNVGNSTCKENCLSINGIKSKVVKKNLKNLVLSLEKFN